MEREGASKSCLQPRTPLKQAPCEVVERFPVGEQAFPCGGGAVFRVALQSGKAGSGYGYLRRVWTVTGPRRGNGRASLGRALPGQGQSAIPRVAPSAVSCVPLQLQHGGKRGGDRQASISGNRVTGDGDAGRGDINNAAGLASPTFIWTWLRCDATGKPLPTRSGTGDRQAA